jgi:hypothetical protein
LPAIVPPPSLEVHDAPPFVERSTPPRRRPYRPYELKAPMPARTVSGKFAAERSNAMAPIESEGMVSVSGVHVGDAAVAFVVFHTPPFALPM